MRRHTSSTHLSTVCSRAETKAEKQSEKTAAKKGENENADAEAWRNRAEHNRQLRRRYAADPASLTADELRRAVVLLERGKRKLRQAEDKTKPGGKKTAGDEAETVSAESEPAAVAEAAKPSKKRAPRADSVWAEQADSQKLDANQSLRDRLRQNDPTLQIRAPLPRPRALRLWEPCSSCMSVSYCCFCLLDADM